MYEAGGEMPSFMYISSGEWISHLPNSERKLEKGDTLWVDGGVYVEGYTCDFSRIATIGKSTTKQRQIHKEVLKMRDIMLEKVRPGVRVSEIFDACDAEFKRLGYLDTSMGSWGHGMGMLINEPPLIARWDETVLSEGLFIGIEPGFVVPEGNFIWEEMLHIKENGYDLLTTETSDLIEIPW